ncbi:uncharacterized protein MELLADRAFT_123973 [Melampsora larici-populina 98AG31]|uniref:Secreted protein n=1 Tax=Melampsora larici-populina (strain 98AG31 / pathotype 3-4-7) TaxID=747676 RepID=F4R9N9_MELLP|nr:uncharacterized protein MELLADRAFT_123973 [Melampsora larici-populina 98AG31]EGG11116.1 secreted protein [Melampsora larici-populina 98AG31]
MLSFLSCHKLFIIFIGICVTRLDFGLCSGGVGEYMGEVKCTLQYRLGPRGKNHCMGDDSRAYECDQCTEKRPMLACHAGTYERTVPCPEYAWDTSDYTCTVPRPSGGPPVGYRCDYQRGTIPGPTCTKCYR